MTLRSGLGFLVWLVALGPEALLAQEAPNARARFLSQKEAAQAITDESMEPYFSILQPLEMIAKTGSPLTATDLAAERDECRRRYREAAREFTEDEKSALSSAVEEIRKTLRPTYAFYAETPWSFIKMDKSIEGGMPHTRGPHIVMSDRMATQLARLRAQGVNPARSRLGQSLIHEQCHVLQRAYPALFADLYTNDWGFIRAKGLPSGPWLDRLQIVNPDGPDVGWVFPEKDGETTRYWQPLVTLKEGIEQPKMPRDFMEIGVALDKKGTSFAPRVAKDGKPEIQELKKIPGFAAAFGNVPENFHPNETFAVLFAWLAMKDHLGEAGPGLQKHPAIDFSTFREWCRRNLATAPGKK